MTSLRTIPEKGSGENVKFGISINEFYLSYHYKGKKYELHTHDLKEIFSFYLIGINNKVLLEEK